MEIRRNAAQRPGEQHIIVPEASTDEVRWEGGNLLLVALKVPSRQNDGSFYNYELYLTPSDLKEILSAVGSKIASRS